MQCPHCSTHFHENWSDFDIRRYEMGAWRGTAWKGQTAHCPKCDKLTIEIMQGQSLWKRVEPLGAGRPPAPPEVPTNISADYSEACVVLNFSPKASAALSRRCLQAILDHHGYKGRDLSKQIDSILAETDASKAIPVALRDTIDGVRNFGNFSAHPITDQTTLQVIDVEPHEAEWCLDTIEEMFQHFYVQPALAKARRAALDAKLAAGGKPPSK